MTERIIKIAGVRFRENWKVYDFDATDIEVAIGDKVIVDSERGQGFATVVRLKKHLGQFPPAEPQPVVQMEHGLQVEEEVDTDAAPVEAADDSKQKPQVLRKILRRANEDDLVRESKNMEREAEAFKIGQDMITEREMPMKLIRVEYSFDASRVTFFFFSETRVDFRELVKDLAYKLKSRIEMRQIGVRDVARMIGGFGPCGRELCCASFLKNFEPVSIRMAKKQEMVLNPAKISGVCGRLLCCLSYEYEIYDEIKKDMAGMRDAAVKEKKEEDERRVAEEQKDAEERRQAEDMKRQDERKQEEGRRGKKKDDQRGGRPEKKKEPQRSKTAQQPSEAQRQVKEEKRPTEEQAAQRPQQEGDKTGKRKKRRFWRKKKKGQPGGEIKTQGPETS
ncbi:MAG TPA: regulatory iron-sulfur-containing complex subunit RicT [Nitrospirota bacterium]|nr:regulatory iron-sulfur-containing complex subunit RicT [Nitrospirota bacterium]